LGGRAVGCAGFEPLRGFPAQATGLLRRHARSSGRGSPFDPDEAAHVVRQIGEGDARGSADEADAADDQAHAALLAQLGQ